MNIHLKHRDDLVFLPLHVPAVIMLKDAFLAATGKAAENVIDAGINKIKQLDAWIEKHPALYNFFGGRTPTLPHGSPEAYAYLLENFPKFLNKKFIALAMADTLRMEEERRRFLRVDQFANAGLVNIKAVTLEETAKS